MSKEEGKIRERRNEKGQKVNYPWAEAASGTLEALEVFGPFWLWACPL